MKYLALVPLALLACQPAPQTFTCREVRPEQTPLELWSTSRTLSIEEIGQLAQVCVQHIDLLDRVRANRAAQAAQPPAPDAP